MNIKTACKMLLLAGLAAVSVGALAQYTTQPIPGMYERVHVVANDLTVLPPLVPQGMDNLTLDIYEAFECPHCQAFYPKLAALHQQYGKRLIIRQHFLVLNPARLNPGMRLYMVAQAAGKGPRAADMLMQSGLDEMDDKQMIAASERVAEVLDLTKQFRAALANPDMKQQIIQNEQGDTFVTETPTLILDDQLQLEGGLTNAELVINSLLKPE